MSAITPKADIAPNGRLENQTSAITEKAAGSRSQYLRSLSREHQVPKSFAPAGDIPRLPHNRPNTVGRGPHTSRRFAALRRATAGRLWNEDRLRPVGETQGYLLRTV